MRCDAKRASETDGRTERTCACTAVNENERDDDRTETMRPTKKGSNQSPYYFSPFPPLFKRKEVVDNRKYTATRKTHDLARLALFCWLFWFVFLGGASFLPFALLDLPCPIQATPPLLLFEHRPEHALVPDRPCPAPLPPQRRVLPEPPHHPST